MGRDHGWLTPYRAFVSSCFRFNASLSGPTLSNSCCRRRGLGVFFSSIFVLEAYLKIAGLGLRQYFAERWNQFDFILVVAAICDTTFTFLDEDNLPFNPIILRLLRLARAARIVRLVRGFKSIVHMLRTLVLSLPALFNVACLQILLMYIFAVVGVYAFWDIDPLEKQFLTDRYVSFNQFGAAFLTLFRCVTGEAGALSRVRVHAHHVDDYNALHRLITLDFNLAELITTS